MVQAKKIAPLPGYNKDKIKLLEEINIPNSLAGIIQHLQSS